MTDEYDFIIKNCLIVDGTGDEPYKAEISIKDEQIKVINKKIEGDTVRVIDASGHVVTPGFIDVHNHGDLSILYYPKAEGFVMQGITTFVGGQCGNSMGPFGDYIGLPWLLNDLYTDISPKMYVKDWLQPRDLVNVRHKEIYGWEITWHSMAEYMERVEKQGLSPNMAPMVGHGDIRSLVMGPDFKRHATKNEIKDMVEHTNQAMLEGCIGLSVGRDYDPGIWADFDEILACAKEAAKHNGLFSSHCLRTGHRKPRRPGEFPPVKTKGLLEAIEIARIAKIPVQVSHLGIVYDIRPDDNKDLMMKALESTLKIIDEARAEGLEVDFDTIPHHLTGGIGTTPWLIHTLRPWLLVAGTPIQLAKALSMPDFREEIKEKIWSGKHYGLNPNINPKWASTRVIVECSKKEYFEKTVAEIAKEKDIEELEALFDIIEADPYTKAIREGDDDWVKLEFYKHPNMMIGVDTFAVDEKRQSSSDPPSYPNQNSYGGFPRFLRRVIKETNTLSIQEAVRKITSSPATKFRLINRGILKENYYADLVIWHPEIITDKGNQIEPRKYPEGIQYVMVNGVLVVDNSKHTGNLPGKVLKRLIVNK